MSGIKHHEHSFVHCLLSGTGIMSTAFYSYFHFSVQKSIYVNIANYLHFYYVISKTLHIEYLKST